MLVVELIYSITNPAITTGRVKYYGLAMGSDGLTY